MSEPHATPETTTGALAAIVEPLREQQRRLNDQIAELSAQLLALRDERNRIGKVLTLLDPKTTLKQDKNEGRKGYGSNIAPAKLAAMTEWLQAHAEELNSDGGFIANRLVNHPDWNLGTQSTAASAVKALHEQGVLRIVGRTQGGGNRWKVVV